MSERHSLSEGAGAAVAHVRYRSELDECRERLREVASRSGGGQVAAMVDEAKLLRASLVFAAGGPLGAPAPALIAAATAIELLHLASLVHDDIIDGALMRRGVSALHLVAGRDRALVFGDLLIVAGFDVISQVRAAVPSEAYAAAVEALSRGSYRCCLGQLEELDPDLEIGSEERYLDVVANKTGSLFSTAASLGALTAGAGEADAAALAALGTRLGVAYQIRDDLRDRHEGELSEPCCAAQSRHTGGDPRFSPTSATYARAILAVRAALERVPEACEETLRVLVGTALRAPSQPPFVG